MNTEIRRARLQEVLERRFEGVQATAATGMGVSQQWLSDVLNGRRAFGERVARRVEGALGLEPGWLDKERGRLPRADMLEVVIDGEVVATVPAHSAIQLRLKRS